MKELITIGILALTAPFANAQPSDQLDIESYALVLTIPFDHSGHEIANNTLQGKASITISEIPSAEVSLLLHRLLNVEKIEDDEGHSIPFHQKVAAIVQWETFQVNHITVPNLKSRVITVYYSGHVVGYEETGMLYVKESLDPAFTIIRPESFTYPQLMEPVETSLMSRWRSDDRFDQQVVLTIPGHHLPAIAYRPEVRDASQTMRTWCWTTTGKTFIIPIAPYETIEKSNYRIYHMAEDKEGAQRIAKAIDQVYQLYEKWMGPLEQHQRFTLAEIPENFGSQVAMPLMLQTAASFKNPQAIGELYHEISHFWNVRDKDVLSPRWNEGQAMFLQYLAYEKLNESGTLMPSLNGRLQRAKQYFAEHENEIAVVDYGKEGVTSALSYDVVPLFFYVLGEVMGRESLLAALGSFYRQYQQQGAGLYDLPDFISQVDSRTKAAFDDWYFSSRYIDQLQKAKDVTALVDRYR